MSAVAMGLAIPISRVTRRATRSLFAFASSLLQGRPELTSTYFICGIAALFAAERLWGARPADWIRNLQSFGVYAIVAITLLPLIPEWKGFALIAGDKLPFWAGFALFFFVKDFGEYVFHRAQHRIPFLWAMHSLHHSDPDVDVLTTGRHFWGDQLLKAVTIWPVALMIVSPTPEMLAAYSVAGFVNCFAHSNLPIDLGRWSWVINSPAYHRRHHSTCVEHYDSNYAAVFPIFDVMFRSYFRPDGFPATGLASMPESLRQVIAWPLIWRRRSTPEGEATADQYAGLAARGERKQPIQTHTPDLR
jgi:sterol desaturase/sphingolipid hydroxylase (fatty acid hydroxylase superfamily)